MSDDAAQPDAHSTGTPTSADTHTSAGAPASDALVEVNVAKNGPYTIKGPIALTDHEGNTWDLPADKPYALCRCGQSGTKPFCDGTHNKGDFDSNPTTDSQPWPWAT